MASSQSLCECKPEVSALEGATLHVVSAAKSLALLAMRELRCAETAMLVRAEHTAFARGRGLCTLSIYNRSACVIFLKSWAVHVCERMDVMRVWLAGCDLRFDGRKAEERRGESAARHAQSVVIAP